MSNNAALLIIDVQNDFCPGGSLAVPHGDRVIEPLNSIATAFAVAGLPVIASRDWHPVITKHFKAYGGVWPVHCVQETPGAAFHPDLNLPDGTQVVTKGNDPDSDSYSAFDGIDMHNVLLGQLLASLNVSHLIIGGLATDYCVKTTVLDALKAGFDVTLLSDAIAGVDVVAGDSEKALEDMNMAGAMVRISDDVIKLLRHRSIGH